jgi:ribonuclease T1
MKRLIALLSVLWLLCISGASYAWNDSIAVGELPPEAQETLRLIDQGGPFPYARDGVTFGNYEHRLPEQKRGYYREYTVATPGLRYRGAQRIIAGKRGERYYTVDHYQTFRRVIE